MITFNDTHYRAMKQDSGSTLSSILPALTTKVVPTLTKTILPGFATGVASALGSLGIDKIFGNGTNFHNSKVGDIIKALAIIQNELSKLPKEEKNKFDKVMMMSGNGKMEGSFLSPLLASVGIPMIMKLFGSGLHNTPYNTSSGYKTHRKKIPIPQKPSVKEPEGTALNWQPYNPPPFYDDHEIMGVKGYGVKKKSENHGEGILFGKDSPFSKIPLLNILF